MQSKIDIIKYFTKERFKTIKKKKTTQFDANLAPWYFDNALYTSVIVSDGCPDMVGMFEKVAHLQASSQEP